ncbi:winged helix DNA-binding domain-containing protein [Nonomuraea mangrovi]|uniref:Winged helix DNA-binding domain-containing protein n=1 Tax=Nonomuraea mangrovi TaxID=2316207 RepID=A0ABW4T0V0_9ACTN
MPNDLRRARLSAQLLHRPSVLDAGEMVRHLLAVQAQDVPSALLAFRARSASVTVKEIEAAWEDREIVRAWGPRGTLHFVHRDDLPWLLALTRNDTGTMRRLAQEGVTGDDLPALIGDALAGQGPLTKAQLEARLAGRAKGQGVVHLVALAAFHGLAVLGPLHRGKPTYVHAVDWLGAPVTFEQDRDRALAELALRYLRAHAPATPDDLAAWSGLPLGTARAAFDLIASRLEAAPLGGFTLRGADAEAGGQTNGAVRLAPAFDEYLLGWADRALILEERHRRAVFPGGGILRPVMLADGVIEGTWSRKGEEVTLAPFEQRDPGPWKAEVADVRAYLSGSPRP